METTWLRDSLFPRVSRFPLAPVTLLAGSLLVSGCSLDSLMRSDSFEPVVDAYNQWDTPFDRMGIVPVQPPSEDIRVGDIFVYPFNPDLQVRSSDGSRRNEISISPRWDSIGLLRDLEEEYLLRPDWPATPDGYLQSFTNQQAAVSAAPDATQGRSLFSGDRPAERLRTFGVPELNTFVLSDEQANSMVPSEAINLVFGSAWQDNKVVALRINSAETYSLGLRKIISAALDETGADIVVREPYRNQLSLIADPAKASIYMRILSDVVYVRSIDIIIQSKAGFEEDEEAMASEFVVEDSVTVTEVEMDASDKEQQGGQAASAETSSQDAAELDDDSGNGEVIHTETVTETTSEHVLDPAYAAFVRANAINEILIEANADSLSESYLRFVSVTDDSVTVRRVWPRGLAIGARGLSLEVDKFTGAVLRSGNMGTLIP